jgi:hypothetical protein
MPEHEACGLTSSEREAGPTMTGEEEEVAVVVEEEEEEDVDDMEEVDRASDVSIEVVEGAGCATFSFCTGNAWILLLLLLLVLLFTDTAVRSAPQSAARRFEAAPNVMVAACGVDFLRGVLWVEENGRRIGVGRWLLALVGVWFVLVCLRTARRFP